MTTSRNTSNPVPAPTAGGASGVPSEAQLRGVPAAASGVTGGAPTDANGLASGTSAEAAYYFLQAAQPSSPQVLPLLNVAPPGAEPPLGFTVPATAGGADPRGVPGRTAVPGQHLGSTAPATPAVELGAQPFVPAVPPASSFAPPNEVNLRPAPAVAAGATKAAHSPISPSQLYFLDEVHHPDRLATIDLPAVVGIRPELLAKTR